MIGLLLLFPLLILSTIAIPDRRMNANHRYMLVRFCSVISLGIVLYEWLHHGLSPRTVTFNPSGILPGTNITLSCICHLLLDGTSLFALLTGTAIHAAIYNAPGNILERERISSRTSVAASQFLLIAYCLITLSSNAILFFLGSQLTLLSLGLFLWNEDSPTQRNTLLWFLLGEFSLFWILLTICMTHETTELFQRSHQIELPFFTEAGLQLEKHLTNDGKWLWLSLMMKTAQFPFFGWLVRTRALSIREQALIQSMLVPSGVLIFLKLCSVLPWNDQLGSLITMMGLLSFFLLAASAAFQRSYRTMLNLLSAGMLGFIWCHLGNADEIVRGSGILLWSTFCFTQTLLWLIWERCVSEAAANSLMEHSGPGPNNLSPASELASSQHSLRTHPSRILKGVYFFSLCLLLSGIVTASRLLTEYGMDVWSFNSFFQTLSDALKLLLLCSGIVLSVFAICRGYSFPVSQFDLGDLPKENSSPGEPDSSNPSSILKPFTRYQVWGSLFWMFLLLAISLTHVMFSSHWIKSFLRTQLFSTLTWHPHFEPAFYVHEVPLLLGFLLFVAGILLERKYQKRKEEQNREYHGSQFSGENPQQDSEFQDEHEVELTHSSLEEESRTSSRNATSPRTFHPWKNAIVGMIRQRYFLDGRISLLLSIPFALILWLMRRIDAALCYALPGYFLKKAPNWLVRYVRPMRTGVVQFYGLAFLFAVGVLLFLLIWLEH